jgi:predicted regulator of amino acid metabolism with ACT domain
MWSEIIAAFSDSPSQAKVARFLLENGFSVNSEGRIACNGIPIPSTQVSKVLHTDRRVVDATAARILASPGLKEIFLNMRATPDLTGIAEALGLSIIVILPRDAREQGIVGACVEVMTRHNLSIRQIFVTDPLLAEEPRLVIIMNEPLPVGTVEEIRNLPQVRQVMI